MGYRVCAHCEGLAGTELAIEAGVDTIEHGMYLNQRPDLLERMAANGQVLVPTLSFLLHLVGRDPAAGDASPTWTPLLVELGRHNVEQAQLTLVAARDAGVRLAMGHDTAPLHAATNELLRMIEAGLTAREALVAATSGSAYALGLSEHVGTVEPGKLADLIVVDGDPLAEPEVLCDRGTDLARAQAGRAGRRDGARARLALANEVERLADAQAPRLLDQCVAEGDVAQAQPAVPEEDPLVVRLAARPVADHDLAELGVESRSRRAGPCRRARAARRSCPSAAWPQSSTTTLSMTSVSVSSTALIVPYGITRQPGSTQLVRRCGSGRSSREASTITSAPRRHSSQLSVARTGLPRSCSSRRANSSRLSGRREWTRISSKSNSRSSRRTFQ